MTLPHPNLYGLMIAIGVWLGITVSEKAYSQLKLSKKDYLDFSIDELLLYLFIPTIIGARTYHVIDLWDFYSKNPGQIIAIWQGGIGIYGGIMGGILGIIYYIYRKHQLKPFSSEFKTAFLQILDVLSFGIPVAQAIGRIGNFFNQELFGLPTKLPWGIFIRPENRPAEFANITHFHPLFAYEGILNLLLALFLYKKLNKNQNLKPGFFFGTYMIGYGIIRFILEYLRINPWTLGFITTGQIVSLFFIVCGVLIIRRKAKLS